MINKIIKLSKKKSIFRFPPDPNGYLHIGHSFSIIINYYLSFLKNGNFIIRFDNSNLSNKKINFYYFILYDLIWLGIKWHKIKYFLNEIKKYFFILIYLFKKKKIFFKKKCFIFRILFNYLNYLNIFYIISINFFKKKKIGFFKKKKIVYRKKTKKKNICFFPTYDFSQCYNDYINNIKTSICTKEFKLNSKIYNLLLKNIKFKPIQIEFEKKKIKNKIISKKKLKKIFFLNIFYFRKIKINQKNIKFLCNFIGCTEKTSFIKNKIIINSILLEKNIFFSKCYLFIYKYLLNIKKYILLSILNNNNNLNLNLNIIKIKKNIKINLMYINFFLNNFFFFFSKKKKFFKYNSINEIIILIKITLKKKKINLKKKKHCLYENNLFYNKIKLINK
ncbi:glutamate--tRNA ligase family protein [Candidatus Carsonella ruddii]|uniref:Glutaminyl-tRNA synthetase n=1 Tax=Candidatus Carsonella ruddii HC isolate Thao2000 TaxID=1202538 RepID=J3TE88_CARRU|nr:glutamate--tRNA ligase family protein [Candidatus Carsonella ruddii]AFP83937.1 glutaminyl-tRNA synthetase [Candidatus Carsonella ruddii HC isolate Thao2000]